MLMRRILVDHARKKNYQKRGGDMVKVPWDTGLVVTRGARVADLEALDDALEALEKLDPRKAKVVEMKFFGGMTVEETAAALEGIARYGDARLAAGRRHGCRAS